MNESELTDKHFMNAYGQSAGIGTRFLLLFFGLFIAIFGFFFPGYTTHRVMQIIKKVSNYGDGLVKKMFYLTKEYE
jgi:Na+/H+ antiporter NhaD/arsenite permease-like protein